MAPPRGFEPRSSHSKCGILPLDEGGVVPPRGFEPLPAGLKDRRPDPIRRRREGWGGQGEPNPHRLGGSQGLCHGATPALDNEMTAGGETDRSETLRSGRRLLAEDVAETTRGRP